MFHPRFDTPVGAVLNICEISEGDILWHVYGVRNSKTIGRMRVIREPMLFSEHPTYKELHGSWLGGQHIISFIGDTEDYFGRIITERTAYCLDCNVGGSHNSNYLFKDKRDAERYMKTVIEYFEAHPIDAEEKEWMNYESDHYDDD